MRITYCQRFSIVLVLSIIIILILIGSHKNEFKSKLRKYNYDDFDENRLFLWWTPLSNGKGFETKRVCGAITCLFVENRDIMLKHKIKNFIFYGTRLDSSNLPLPRNQNDIWALFHEESPKNTPLIIYESAISLFNYTSTFSRYSSIPRTLQYMKSIDVIVDSDFVESVAMKNNYQKINDLAQIVFIQSICSTVSGRNEFVQELQKHIKIDSYGKCLNNKKLPATLTIDYLNNLRSPEFLTFIAQYKFVIAYENAVCDDYITEKFWRALEVGVVPIYFGAPNIRDWLPNNKSAILVDDFPNAKSLANYIKYLNENDEEYLKYLEHKYNIINPIDNKRLLYFYYARPPHKDLLESFECFLCNQMNSNYNDVGKPFMANHRHYNCSNRAVFPKMLANKNLESEKEWNNILSYSACEANVLNYYIRQNRNYTSNEFQQEIKNRIKNNNC